MSDNDETDSWFDKHPYASDALLTAIPGLGMLSMGLVFNYPMKFAIGQAVVMSALFFVGLLYLERTTGVSAFRTFGPEKEM